MAADFDAVCWLLDHDFTSVCIGGHQYFSYTHQHKTFYVRQTDPADPLDFYRDQYVCYINKTVTHSESIVNSGITFTSKDFVRATGVKPKQAIRNAITKSYADPEVKAKDELRSFDLTLNPVLWFIKDCIEYLTKHM